jgi:phage tail sheath protein FI
VYIDEFAPAPPIQGVGTSTPAFIGPASRGVLDEPTLITSWDRFREVYGAQPLPGFYLWYTVRGFFENGGTKCYIVRASNGTYARLDLLDRAGNNVIRVRSLQPGAPATQIEIEVTDSHALAAANTSLYQPTVNFNSVSGRDIMVNSGDGLLFRPGDFVTLDALGERVQVSRIVAGTPEDTIRLAGDLSNAYGAGQVRLADAPAGERTVRIETAAAPAAGTLVSGTVLTVAQGAMTDTQTVESVQTESGAITTYRVTFREGLRRPLSLDSANPATVESEEFDFQVTQGTPSPAYQFLSMDSAHPRYFETILNEQDGLVHVELVQPPPAVPLPNSLPAATGGRVPLAGGINEDLSTLANQDFIDALAELESVDEVNMISIPDQTAAAVQQAVITHCENMQDRFAVLDALPPAPDQPLSGAGSVDEQRQGLDSTRGYAALYYPWLEVPRAVGDGNLLVPPSGHVCGIFARSDQSRGVHKAPANEIVRGALGVSFRASDTDQGVLNDHGINVIRIFQGSARPMLWGARTTATDLNWRYVNIRRLFLYLEESIQEGIRWAVFEPNNLKLWKKLKRTITAFLTTEWRNGALFGETPEKAFYVRIDEELNPFSEQQLGRLHIEIGVRPSYPAEFIIVRIGIWSGGSEVTES